MEEDHGKGEEQAMKILVLGGTVFLGRHIVEAALARGHEVTLFNRGQHNPDLFPQVEKLRGNRDGDLSALEGRSWDAVVDTSGYLPRVVRQSAEALKERTNRYVFISTISVYADEKTVGQDESAPLATLEDENVEEITGETYGGLKVLCERVVQETYPDRALIIRPGLIVGPDDPTDRYTYWPVRVARGGEVLVPGRPERAVQYIDVRDLSEWTVRMVEEGKTGVYNANGPDYVHTMEQFLDACKGAAGSDARFVWIPEQFLLDREVGQWMELPLWVAEEEAPGFFAYDVSKAVRDGLTFRSAEETARDTIAWERGRPADHEWRAGMKAEREAALLEEWKTAAQA
jgi:2'-hydroxyisoflavone reductase